jgi:signal transduction histidine kinase
MDVQGFGDHARSILSEEMGSESFLIPDAHAPFAPASSATGTPRPPIEAALREAQKMAVVGQMAGGIAHDFNNLLQSVAAALEVMQKRIDQGRTGELAYPMDLAHMSLTRAADLTHRLLAFSRPHEVEPQSVEVDAIIATMEALLRCTLGPKVDLRLVLGGGDGSTRCDLHQFENVLLNLAINARDAMPDGGKLVIETFAATLCYDQGDLRRRRCIGICVADSGIGMPREVVERAFDPFYTTKPEGRGTGLGLALTKRFVDQCDGCINIESVVGQGTTISLYLPSEADEDA